MPSQRPSAAFDPLPPDLDLAALVEETPNFEYVTRVSCEMIDTQGMEQFERLVLLHVILGGKPLVIEGFHHRLDEWTFTSQWLRDNCGSKFENARNLGKQQLLPLSIGHYLKNLSKLTNQWTPTNYRDTDRQRIYLKDIDCPALWQEKLEIHIPPSIFYLNRSTGDFGGPGAQDAVLNNKSNLTGGRGIARAGDLMSSLPPEVRAENLMCYIGHEGTYTPAHREMCASLGQNIMVETSGSVDEEGRPAKPGSSIWFMTETSDRHLVSEYWLSTLGHDIEVEKHFAQINAWKAAPFTTYMVEQRVGDFILIPPLAAHQVWNRGTRTMKVAWNRTTIETLEMALHEALPRARMVCRDEQYKNKAIVYFTLQKYSELLNRVESLKRSELKEQAILDLNYNSKIRQLQKDFKRLFLLYTEILLSETLAPVAPGEKKGQYLPYDGFVTCSYCRCNIFNRFLTCESCIEAMDNGEENTYDICMECFVMGRSCKCISNLKWVEQFPWQELVENHENWRCLIISLDGGINENSPRSLQRERKNLELKTLAQVCQEQLKIRPWNDPKNPRPILTTAEMNSKRVGRDNTRDEDDDTPSRTPKKKGPAKLESGFVLEHVGGHPREAWKCAACAKCNRSFQYGSLWRMFDLMPQTVMEQYEWECPVCQKFCSCGSCRRKADNIPYEPRGTILGHDTRKVADVRSVESLVDFSMSNLHHIKKAEDDTSYESRRLERRIDEAAQAKAQDPELGDHYVEGEEVVPVAEQFYKNGIRYTTEPDIPIDPLLNDQQPAIPTTSNKKSNPAQKSLRQGGESVKGGASQKSKSRTSKIQRNQNGVQKEAQQSKMAKKLQDLASRSLQTNGIGPTATMRPEDNDALSDSPTAAIDDPNPEPSLLDFTKPSEALDGDSGEAPSLYHQAQVDRTLQEAQRNNRYIIAEAALTGKSLPVTLKVGTVGMALTADRLTYPPASAPQMTTEGDKELLRSDVPLVDQSTKPPASSKKRKIRDGEDDDEFSTRKKKESKSKTSAASHKEVGKAADPELHESSSDSELGVDSFTAINRPKGPRSLPKYLADQHEDGDLPTSLPPDLPRKRASQAKASKLNVGNNISRPAALRKADAGQIAEENRRAKQKAVQWADDDGTDSSSSEAPQLARGTQTQSVLGKAKESLMKVPQSMLSRMAGKKFKVVAAKR